MRPLRMPPLLKVPVREVVLPTLPTRADDEVRERPPLITPLELPLVVGRVRPLFMTPLRLPP